jgi:signal transduction histidine kinase
MATMLSKISLKIRITLLTMIALSFVTASITVLSNYNANQNLVIPFEILFENLGLELNDIQTVPRFEIQDGISTPINPIPYDTAAMKVFTRTSQSNFQNYSIIVAAIFVLLGTVLAYVISGQTLKPIKSLAEKIKVIDENNLDIKIEPPKSNDETARLTNSFNNMLEKLDRSFKTQKLFAQNAAHELKTPLSFIRASVEVLQLEEKPTEDSYIEVIEIVKDSTERLIGLVEGLLSLNSAVDEQQWQTFNVREIFEIIFNELETDITRKTLNVSISGDCFIKGNKTLLERAFFNLVHNAVRYNIENGKVSITLANGNIIIEDSGVGIPKEHLTNIFEPFYCVDKSRSKKLGGYGLGMSIAKSIFDRHDIKIRIYSEPGNGTKIILDK